MIVKVAGEVLATPRPVVEEPSFSIFNLPNPVEMFNNSLDYMSEGITAGVAKLFSMIGEALISGAGVLVNGAITSINMIAPEIVTTGVVICSLCLMGTAFTGGDSAKWIGRGGIILIGGSFWRILTV